MAAVLIWPRTILRQARRPPGLPRRLVYITRMLDARRRRLLFRACHRGTHENDLMIGGFVAPRIGGFTPDELDALEELLELSDTALADWLSGRRPIPADIATPMMRAIAAHVAAGGAVVRP